MLQGVKQGRRIRFALRQAVPPHHHWKKFEQVQGFQHPHGEIVRLVGHHGQLEALRLEPCQGFRHAGEGVRSIGHMPAIIVQQHLHGAVEMVILARLRGVGVDAVKASRHQHPRAAADQVANLLQRQGIQVMFGEHMVERRADVGGGIHQGAVQIKEQGASGKGFRLIHCTPSRMPT